MAHRTTLSGPLFSFAETETRSFTNSQPKSLKCHLERVIYLISTLSENH